MQNKIIDLLKWVSSDERSSLFVDAREPVFARMVGRQLAVQVIERVDMPPQTFEEVFNTSVTLDKYSISEVLKTCATAITANPFVMTISSDSVGDENARYSSAEPWHGFRHWIRYYGQYLADPFVPTHRNLWVDDETLEYDRPYSERVFEFAEGIFYIDWLQSVEDEVRYQTDKKKSLLAALAQPQRLHVKLEEKFNAEERSRHIAFALARIIEEVINRAHVEKVMNDYFSRMGIDRRESKRWITMFLGRLPKIVIE